LNSIHNFETRHIGIQKKEEQKLLSQIGVDSVQDLINQTIPDNIRLQKDLDISEALSEAKLLQHLREVASKNEVYTSCIGMGYYNCITPAVIQRNIFENPGWYTQYTPYQAEISQGRLEALLNFQTLVADLTALPIANASLLDEATAAAESMIMLFNQSYKKNRKNPKHTFLIDQHVFPQTKAVLETRAEPLQIKVVEFNASENQLPENEDVFGILLQYPNKEGAVLDYEPLANQAAENNIFVAVAADILALTLLKPPGEWGADVVVGSTQRLGIPMGYGGPHAAYYATKDAFLRGVPGRIIGLSKDQYGQPALRMALQTREQHIRRGKATSNICTAQALLAIMASMYAVYHGAEGLENVAQKVHKYSSVLKERLSSLGINFKHQHFFDTLCIDTADLNKEQIKKIQQYAIIEKFNFWFEEKCIQISLDECTTVEHIQTIEKIFKQVLDKADDQPIQYNGSLDNFTNSYPEKLIRQSAYLTHPVFSSHHSETQMMRYIKSLENKDLSLTTSMIPLGSCTMKLNAAVQLMPLSWAEFAHIHPFAPLEQAKGYQFIIDELAKDLSTITGMAACSLQPNSGAQGEYAGLMVIRAYHKANEQANRKVVLIPSSSHGTNPASAVMAGMQVVVITCNEYGDIDIDDLQSKVTEHKENLAGLMITYPSTHGVFEDNVQDICEIIHKNGGLVYMDGANMNAQVGLTNPSICGADVVHLNLHKTFAIPHGGGGPGMGPICVNEKLKPFLPDHRLIKTGGDQAISAVSAAPFGSTSILLISYAYIKLLGSNGLTRSTEIAILNANYIKSRLEDHYEILFTGKEFGRVAHELIIDLRPFKPFDIDAEDVAKRLIDYAFHAPTMSWPVAGTIMIEPTESEDLQEIDRFCEAMIALRKEIEEVEMGTVEQQNNVLNNAPHTLALISNDNWDLPYTRKKAAYPVDTLSANKFWASVARIDNTYGDKNVICTCPPVEIYASAE